jgi:hypothetical protein
MTMAMMLNHHLNHNDNIDDNESIMSGPTARQAEMRAGAPVNKGKLKLYCTII